MQKQTIFSAIMSVFFRWQIICYLCAGLTITIITSTYAYRTDNMLAYSIIIWKDNI